MQSNPCKTPRKDVPYSPWASENISLLLSQYQLDLTDKTPKPALTVQQQLQIRRGIYEKAFSSAVQHLVDRIELEEIQGRIIPHFKLHGYMIKHLRNHYYPFISIILLTKKNHPAFETNFQEDHLYLEFNRDTELLKLDSIFCNIPYFLWDFYDLVGRQFLGQNINLIFFNMASPIHLVAYLMALLVHKSSTSECIFDWFSINNQEPYYVKEIGLPELALLYFRRFDQFRISMKRDVVHVSLFSEDTQLNVLALSGKLFKGYYDINRFLSECVERNSNFLEERAITFKVLDPRGLEPNSPLTQTWFKLFRDYNLCSLEKYRKQKGKNPGIYEDKEEIKFNYSHLNLPLQCEAFEENEIGLEDIEDSDEVQDIEVRDEIFEDSENNEIII